MEAVVPWDVLLALVGPYYSKGEMGRKPTGLGIMLRVCFLRQWFAPSGSWRGRRAIRIGGDAPFCRHRSGPGTGAERNEDPELPPFA
jgi:hypothetical protein